MSIQAVSWAIEHSEATGNDRCVLLAIANRFDPREPRRCWPSRRLIAHEARVSESTVKRSLRTLVELGELLVFERAGGSAECRSDRRPNRYEMPKLMVLYGGSECTLAGSYGGSESTLRGVKTDQNGGSLLTPDSVIDSDIEKKGVSSLKRQGKPCGCIRGWVWRDDGKVERCEVCDLVIGF